MKTKRTLAALLAAVLTSVTLLTALTACATGAGTADTGETTNSSAESTTEELKDNLPDDLNYGGNEIIFISRDIGMNLADEFFAESYTGDPVSDAIFERNKTVENRLGVKITSLRDTDAIVDRVITSVNGGSADYDIMVEYCWLAAPRTIEGYFANLRDTDYVDFDQPWWTQSFNDVMLYGELQFGVTGAMVLSTYRRTYSTVFNKNLFTDANQAYPYEAVKNGTWTLDKQSALVPLLARDDGDGVQSAEGDVFGFVSDDFISVDPYWAACEVDIIQKNADGAYEWVFDSGKMHDVVEKILKLYYNTNSGTYCVTEDDSFQTQTRQMFADGYAAMATLCIHALENTAVRSMTDEYGVVPMPKYDEKQTEYHSQMHDAFTIACIPTTVSGDRLTQMSAVLEAMASASYNIVRPAYYETTLRTKIAQDPQSSEMMELIIDSIHIDAGLVFSHNMGSFHKGLQTVIVGKNNNTISHFKTITKTATKSLNSLVNKLDNLTADP